jgi:hypothetical protein
MLTHEQIQQAVDLLQGIVSISPATAPNEDGLGVCHFCGQQVRDIHSGIIHHTEGCPWWQSRQFVDALPSEWDDLG